MEGKVVVVTGASAGVGRATVRAFAKAGAHLGLLARANPGLQAAAREVEREGGRALVIPIDVADAGQVEAAAARIEAELGPIEVWVNNAMATIFARVWDIQPDEFRRATEVTYLGAVHGTMAALKRMRPRDRGTIVQVGSALAYRSIPLQAAYCGAQARAAGLHRLAALRAHERALERVDHDGAAAGPEHAAIHLGARAWPAQTPRPVPPVYRPEIAAEAIVWAAKHKRREVWVGGSTVATILGNRLVPKLADLYLARTNIKGQQTGEQVSADRRDYLFEPVAEDRGADGPFVAEAKSRCWQLKATKHRRVLLGGAAAAAIAMALSTKKLPG